jgi:hypothetical protein
MKGNTRTKLEIPKSLKSKVCEKMKGNCVKNSHIETVEVNYLTVG